MKTPSILFLASATAFATSCTPFQQSEFAQGKTAQNSGALIGAGAGAIIDKDNPLRGAGIGAGFGGMAGQGWSNQYNQKDQATQEKMSSQRQQDTANR